MRPGSPTRLPRWGPRPDVPPHGAESAPWGPRRSGATTAERGPHRAFCARWGAVSGICEGGATQSAPGPPPRVFQRGGVERGCIAGRMQLEFHHGLPGSAARTRQVRRQPRSTRRRKGSHMSRRAGLIARVVAGFLLAFALTSLTHPRVIQAQASAAAAPAALNDPTGATTGTGKDVTVKDPKNPTLTEVMDTVGHNRIALNIVWTLLCGFLVMFMQAGFALVETGLTRAKNVAHTMGMDFMVYAIGMLGYWVCGYALQMGGVGAIATLGGTAPLNHEFTVSLFGKSFGLFGLKGFFLGGDSYDVGVFTLFLFQMVFMDTAA